MQIKAKHVGAVLGFGFGWLIVHYNIFIAVFLAVTAIGGWYLGRVLDGETDIVEYLARRRNQDLEG